MKKFRAEIAIMPHDGLLDPQGKAVEAGLKNLDINNIQNIRIGKHIRLIVTAKDHQAAENVIQAACEKLLANLIMERFTFEVIEIEA